MQLKLRKDRLKEVSDESLDYYTINELKRGLKLAQGNAANSNHTYTNDKQALTITLTNAILDELDPTQRWIEN